MVYPTKLSVLGNSFEYLRAKREIFGPPVVVLRPHANKMAVLERPEAVCCLEKYFCPTVFLE